MQYKALFFRSLLRVSQKSVQTLSAVQSKSFTAPPLLLLKPLQLQVPICKFNIVLLSHCRDSCKSCVHKEHTMLEQH